MTTTDETAIRRAISELLIAVYNASGITDNQANDVEELLSSGRDQVNYVDDSGLSLLHYAAKLNTLETARILLQAGADANAIQSTTGRTPIFHASSAEMVSTLIAGGADICQRDIKGRTALHKAAEDGAAEAIRALIAHGADVNSRDSESWTPLHYAANWHGSDHIIGLLISYGADYNLANRVGMTPRDQRPLLLIPASHVKVG